VTNLNRREFLQTGVAGALALTPAAAAAQRGPAIVLVVDPADAVATAAPCRWAAGELERALTRAGRQVRRAARVEDAAAPEMCVVAAGAQAPIAAAALNAARIDPLRGPERTVLAMSRAAGRPALLAAGSDPRGLVYALLDLADRVRTLGAGALAPDVPEVGRPANPVRSVMRQFTSQTLDSPWFFDREMWPAYLTMLATQRFNRLHLGFGLGYDTLQRVSDSYLLFLYPFLLGIPGYDVRVTNVSDADRARNLDTLRYISEETVARGLDFQLGVWMHGYRLINSPNARYVVEGLTDETHAAYCRDALTALLEACPAISAVALRIHGESGVAEGSYDFWTTVFDGVKRAGRRVEIDLHAKGIDQTMIDRALATGMPVNLSPKYWAEHLGMPYHQTAIRDLEMPVPGRTGAGLMTLSEGARVFTRYGYADLLREDRRYTVRHRVFAGTQRLLLSGDPASAAAWSRMFGFCGSTGADLMEPLTCRGRRGTGAIGGARSGYADAALDTRWDWEKFEYWYRVSGRLLYDPETPAGVWQRALGRGPDARALESALAHATRILPTITTAHLPSAACDAYWPEVYWNEPITVEAPGPYGDTPAPKTFQNTSPLDPQLFSRMTEHAEALIAGEPGARYSPLEVASWLDALAAATRRDLARLGEPAAADRRRAAIDIAIQAGLGEFFAAKFRAGVLYALHERTTDREALERAIAAYGQARAAWAALAARAAVYAADLSVSDKVSNRGHWADRLASIDQDLERMRARLAAATPSADPRVRAAVRAAIAPPARPALSCRHTPPPAFRPGAALPIVLDAARDPAITAARLFYRHVNQAERFESAAMTRRGATFAGEIPGPYTDSPFPLQYYFEARRGAAATLFPGFDAERLNLPYIVVRRTPTSA
jgi:hypothetical protein